MAIFYHDRLKVKVKSVWLFATPVHGILPARILEWVAVPFSTGSFQPRDRTQVSGMQVDSLTAELQGKPMVDWVMAIY